MNSQTKKRAICILGMHRSGTSAVTRLINLCGVYLGEDKDLMPLEATINPEGFWERNDIFALNERLLEKMKSVWCTTLPLPDGWHLSSEMLPFKEEIRKLIDSTFINHPLWAWKDPRSMLLLPLWQSVLEELGIKLSCLYIFRNPLDVAKSLERRESQIPVAFRRPEEASTLSKSFGIWFNYNIYALRIIRGIPTVFVAYERLFDTWEDDLRRLANGSDITWPENSPEVKNKIRSFLRPDLCHSMSNIEDLNNKNAPGPVIELYGLLLKLLQPNHVLHPEIYERIDTLYDEFSDYASFFRDDSIRLWKLIREQEQTAGELSAKNARLSESEAQLTILNSQLEEQDREIRRLRAIEESISWKIVRKILNLVDRII